MLALDLTRKMDTSTFEPNRKQLQKSSIREKGTILSILLRWKLHEEQKKTIICSKILLLSLLPKSFLVGIREFKVNEIEVYFKNLKHIKYFFIGVRAFIWQ